MAGGGASLRREKPPALEGGGARPRCSPAPRLCSGNTWGGRQGEVSSAPLFPLEQGEGEGRGGLGIGLGFRATAGWQSGCVRREGGPEGGSPGPRPPWQPQRGPLLDWPASCPGAPSLVVGPPALVSISVKGAAILFRESWTALGYTELVVRGQADVPEHQCWGQADVSGHQCWGECPGKADGEGSSMACWGTRGWASLFCLLV